MHPCTKQAQKLFAKLDEYLTFRMGLRENRYSVCPALETAQVKRLQKRVLGQTNEGGPLTSQIFTKRAAMALLECLAVEKNFLILPLKLIFYSHSHRVLEIGRDRMSPSRRPFLHSEPLTDPSRRIM